MDEPIEPRDIKRSRTKKLGAIPTRGIKTMASSGPPRIKRRVLYCSARYPAEGWTTKARRRLIPAISPTCVNVREKCSINTGKRGVIKEE